MLADLGQAALAWPEKRTPYKLRPTDWALPVCTPNYRAPDVMLGCQRYGPDLDMWSVGCVAAELNIRGVFFEPSLISTRKERGLLDAQFEVLGTPSKDSSTYMWLESLPLFQKLYAKNALGFPGKPEPEWPPACLQECPSWLTDFVRETLKLRPEERATAASATLRSLLSSRCLSVRIRLEESKRGLGSVAEGALDADVLEYIQGCPAWAILIAECRANNFEANMCISDAEGKLRMKREFVGYTDAKKPPVCKSLNSDAKLALVKSERLQFFVKAMRRRAEEWLHQLTARVRAEIQRQGLPEEYLNWNGSTFMDEDFADNAFVYASVQVMKKGARAEEWHTDGGASLLHAAVTIFGSRTVEVQTNSHDCISLHQRPGSFYIGTFTAMQHRVVHSEPNGGDGSFGDGPAEQVDIAVMLRTDVFRWARARGINTTPGPAGMYLIVDRVVATQIAEESFYLPDLAEVMAVARETYGEPSPSTSKET